MNTTNRDGALRQLSKVPEVTLYIWIIKIVRPFEEGDPASRA